jgi:CRP-like cAMP-binding protein
MHFNYFCYFCPQNIIKGMDLSFFCLYCNHKAPKNLSERDCPLEHTVKYYKKGEHIAFQGNRVSHLYMLTKGKVKAEMVSLTGFALAVDEMVAPQPLASAFLFADDNHFPVDVIAVDDCEVILINKSTIEKHMAVCPGFLMGYMTHTANQVRFLSERLKIFAHKGLKSKIAYYILQHDKNGTFDFGRSVTSLAEYFGVERPSLSRALSEMVSAGIIELKARKGKILKYNEIKQMFG